MENKKEEKQKIEISASSKIFFWVLGLLILGSVAVTFWRIVLNRDYIISAEQECDPATETCFIYTCDPEADSECPADEAERISYYKLIHKNAKNIPLCDTLSGECPTELNCEEGEADCEMILCDESTVAEGETCNDPEKYLKENPPEEECACGKADETEAASEETTGKATAEITVGEETAPDNENANADVSEEENGNDNACSCSEETE